jgi:hypothetical protein
MSEQALLYFAYGSNLHPLRLRKRVPSTMELDVAELAGFALRFHKLSANDGSGKCDAYRTGQTGDVVHGVVFGIAASDKPALDALEGRGYGVHSVTVSGSQGPHEVFTYLADADFIDAALRPFDWYKRLVIAGAELHGFPDAYVEHIRVQPDVADPNQGRADEHEALLAEMLAWP